MRAGGRLAAQPAPACAAATALAGCTRNRRPSAVLSSVFWMIAMTSGETVRVRELVPDDPWLGQAWNVPADELKPLPMKYYGGQVPQ